MSRGARLSSIILCLWTGGLWMMCGVVVPGLFWLLPDQRALAGNLATWGFYFQVWFGALLGLMYWLLRRRALSINSQRWLWAALVSPLVFFVVLRPLMNSARLAGDMARFGQLHGPASVLFLIACVGTGVLAWRHLMPSGVHQASTQ